MQPVASCQRALDTQMHLFDRGFALVTSVVCIKAVVSRSRHAQAYSFVYTAWQYVYSCTPEYTVIDNQIGALSHQHVRHWQCISTAQHTLFGS